MLFEAEIDRLIEKVFEQKALTQEAADRQQTLREDEQ